MNVPENADRDFTGSALVVNDGKLLMLKHSKLDMWLQPGGHVEGEETPDETALRECVEETGFRVEIVDSFRPDESFEDSSTDLAKPFNINLHQIDEAHFHCDFQFLCRPLDQVDASHGHEHDGLKWFTREDLENGNYDMPENARSVGLRAIEYSE
jgi:8-oxo-dGTP pyrophosphatase MutT (NUDIX family)